MRTHRVAFTLVEVLVVVAVVGLLVSLLLPAVQSAREAARRGRCVANLKELGIAIQGYEAVWGTFPPSETSSPSGGRYLGYWSTVSIHVSILPFLEQHQLYQAINFTAPLGAEGNLTAMPPENRTVSRQWVDTFVCPSDPRAVVDPFSPSSYRGCVGLSSLGPPPRYEQEGAFSYGGTSPAEFVDGLSNTLAFSERAIGSGSWRSFSVRRDYLDALEGPRPAFHDWQGWIKKCSGMVSATTAQFDSGASWMTAGATSTTFFTATPPNPPIPDCGVATLSGTGVFSARSYHPGGVVAGMADGSVRFVTNSTAAECWRALGTRHGNEVIRLDPG